MVTVKRNNSILDLIGGTPLVSITRLTPRNHIEILAKLESFNPGGSIKDRPALYMIEDAEQTGALTRDKIILEATSGNTGIGLALVAAVKGYRLLLTMSESVSEERIKILRAMGAEIEFTPARLSTDGAIEHAYKLIREEPEKYWLVDQFNNDANWMAHYKNTAQEIWEQTNAELDIIVATIGTTGTVMGLSRRFKELKPEVQIVGVEPYLGHKIQGLKNMKESYRPGIFEKHRLDRTIHIDDEEAFETTRILARKEGLFVGMSSGAAMAAALKIANETEKNTNTRIVVIMPDGGERYLSTPLFVRKKDSGLKIYNTLTHNNEVFVPVRKRKVTMYSCGPTLCQFIHLGQCRRYVFSDLLRRYLEFKGYQVTHIMNLTDLDDRTIAGAEKEKMTLTDFTEKYHKAFMEDLEKLFIKKASNYPKASEYVDDMIQLTEKLLDNGYAYEKLRSIYFDISRVDDYGALSRIDLNKIRIGKTVDLDQYEKDNPRDFTLLKRSTLKELKQGLFYQTRWGNLRPGWHLECSAMTLKLFGEKYDIHTSGVDLIFPHHENAIAIGKAATGTVPANYWIHNELVMVDGKKPARADKNQSITLRNILDRGHSGREIRYWLLSRHYRKNIHFSWSKLKAVKNTIDHLDTFVQKVNSCRNSESNPDVNQAAYDLKHNFTEAMDDDLNIAVALAALFKFIRKINLIIDKNSLSTDNREKIIKVIREIDSVLGVMAPGGPEKISREAETLIQKRKQSRQNRDWKTADRLRQELKDMGIEVLDTKEGPVWRKT
jgi:cysteinyl-tRNA synthetase